MIVELKRKMLRDKKYWLMPLFLEFFHKNAVKFDFMTSRHNDRL